MIDLETLQRIRPPRPARQTVTRERARLGGLSANKIRTGMVQNPAGTSYWNLDATGVEVELQLGGVTILHDGTTTVGGEVTATSFTGAGATFRDGTFRENITCGATTTPNGSVTLLGHTLAGATAGSASIWFDGISGTGLHLDNSSDDVVLYNLNCTAILDGLISWGANDSGGSGKRALVTDNI